MPRLDVEADVQDPSSGPRRLALEQLRAAPPPRHVSASRRSSVEIVSQRMKPRAMSEWIDAAASVRSARGRRQARVSLSPAVKRVIRSRASRSRRTTSSARRAVWNSAASSSVSASSASSFRSIPPGRSRPRRQLRGQRLELGWQLALVVAEVVPASGTPGRVQLVDLLAQARVARLRLYSTLEPASTWSRSAGLELESQSSAGVASGVPSRHRQDRVDA
jgi:hypothetical protein